MKPAPPRMMPMEHSLRRKIALEPDDGVDDGELRQFITSQLSSHTSTVQSWLEGMEQRLLASINVVEEHMSMSNAHISMLRQLSAAHDNPGKLPALHAPRARPMTAPMAPQASKARPMTAPMTPNGSKAAPMTPNGSRAAPMDPHASMPAPFAPHGSLGSDGTVRFQVQDLPQQGERRGASKKATLIAKAEAIEEPRGSIRHSFLAVPGRDSEGRMGNFGMGSLDPTLSGCLPGNLADEDSTNSGSETASATLGAVEAKHVLQQKESSAKLAFSKKSLLSRTRTMSEILKNSRKSKQAVVQKKLSTKNEEEEYEIGDSESTEEKIRNTNNRKALSLVEEGLRQEIDFAKDFTHTESMVTMLPPDHNLTVREFLQNVMASRPTELIICFLIVANATVIGAQVDSHMKDPNADEAVGFRALDILFTAVFTIELILRWICDGLFWFWNPRNVNVHWNVFDFALVVSSILEELLKLIIKGTPDVSMLRLFRIVRLVRLFRILRVVRFFKDLRIMVSGIANSMQSLVWALLLMFCVMYLVAVFVLQFAADEGEQRAKDENSGNLSDVDFERLQFHFGSMGRTMYTLYMSITGGLDWGEASDPLFSVGWILGCFYLGYVAFSVLCVMNIVTGVFVENCNKMTARDEDLVYMEQLEQRKQWYTEVKDIFDAADEKKTGFLSLKDFSKKVKGDAKLRAWMRKIGVHVETYTARGLFQLLDLDGDGLLDFDEFFIALQQVHGQARSIDIAKVLHDTKLLRRLTGAIMDKLNPEQAKDSAIERSWNQAMWQSEQSCLGENLE